MGEVPAPGGKRPTMLDVAARAGVSRALVSTVFREVPGASPATRDRVLQAARELGYRVDNRARLLRRTRTHLLGVTFRVQDAFHADLVESLYQHAGAAGYELLLSASTRARSESQAVAALTHDRCEGLVLVAPQDSEADVLAVGDAVPTVVVARRVQPGRVDVVRTADRVVVDAALGHLLALGHRDLAHVDGGTIHGSTDRRDAYLGAVAGLGPAAARVLPGGNTEADGARAAQALLADPHRPTAVVAFNDRCAVGLVFALRAAGVRVPEDISVMGYDDVSTAGLPFVALSTVGQDVAATAAAVVAAVTARLDDGGAGGTETFVEPYVVSRSTTGPAPGR